MATPTYTAIASITLGYSASSVTFSSIPQDYRDLVLVFEGTTTNSGDLPVFFNSDTSTSYSRIYAYGDGSSAVSASTTTMPGAAGILESSTANSLNVVQIMDYSANDKHTTSLTRGNTGVVIMTAGRYGKTDVITSLTIDPDGTNTIDAGSTFALWGIAS